MAEIELIATAALGWRGGRELYQLGHTSKGEIWVVFWGWSAICRANLWLRQLTAFNRVGQFKALP